MNKIESDFQSDLALHVDSFIFSEEKILLHITKALYAWKDESAFMLTISTNKSIPYWDNNNKITSNCFQHEQSETYIYITHNARSKDYIS